MRTTHRRSFERFTGELDRATTYQYSHFGYRIDAREAANRIFKEVKKGRSIAYVLLDGERIVGFGHLDRFLKKEKRHVVRLGIVLHQKYQSKGLGKELLDYMVDQATKMGIEKIWLATYADNRRALELYRSLGFVTEGVFRKEEKIGDHYRDIISMALFLKRRFRSKA